MMVTQPQNYLIVQYSECIPVDKHHTTVMTEIKEAEVEMTKKRIFLFRNRPPKVN
jgi:hypothetical protein